MAIELPSEVVDFLQFIGINWPNVNEDSVRALAGHVSDFASNIDGTHQAATQTVQSMGAAYTGASYEQLVETWTKLSSSHMTELIDGCKVVAEALDVAADAIVVAKGVAIAELVALAVSFVADQAAAALTFGIAEAAEALVVEAAKKCVNFLEQELEQMIIGKVLEAALTPLEGVVAKAVDGLVYKGVAAALGESGGATGASFSMDKEALTQHFQTFQDHADAVASHAQTLQSNIASVSFE